MELREICFDMDGTIANLYGVENWLPMLRAENPRPYAIAEPLWNMVELVAILKTLQTQGVKIRIISWLSMDSTEEYKTEVRQAKREWLDRYGFEYDYCNLVQYGTRKQSVIRRGYTDNDECILIDDSQEVRDSWTVGRAINPTDTNIIEFLRGLCDQSSYGKERDKKMSKKRVIIDTLNQKYRLLLSDEQISLLEFLAVNLIDFGSSYTNFEILEEEKEEWVEV